MASVGDELRRRVYGAADPTKEQIQTVREAAYEAPAWTQGKSKGISSAAQGGESAGDELRRRVYGGTAAPTSKGYSASGIVSRVGQTGAVTSTQAEDKMPTLAGRIKSTVSGALKSTGAEFSNAGGVLLDAVREMDTRSSTETRRAYQEAENAAHYREMLSRGTLDDGTVIDDAARQQLETLAKRAEQRSGIYRESAEAQHEPVSQVISGVYDTADHLADDAAADLENAKRGAGAVGGFLVDAGAAGAQLAGDIALAALTGGSALPAMAVRSFGGSAQEARRSGADLGQQLSYGAGSAALSVATEKISNVASPFRKAFGAGAAEKLAGKLVSRFGENTAVQTMNKLAQTTAGRLAASAIGEGSEEFVEAVFQPVLQRATYDPDADFDMGQALYDAAIGATLGGVGGAVDVGMGRMQGRKETVPAPSGVQELSGKDGAASATEPAVVVRAGKSALDSQKGLARTLAASIKDLGEMQPVAELTGREMNNRAKKPSEQIRDFFKRIGGAVTRSGFGEVSLGEYGVGGMLNHRPLNRAKMVSITAVPEVIQNGKQIAYHPNWKGRGYASYVFAAPVTIAGTPTYVAAVVDQRPDNKFYLSEVVDSEGNYIRIEEAPSGDTKSGVTVQDGVTTTPEGASSIDSTIPRGAESVNRGTPDPADVDLVARILSGGTDMGSVQSQEIAAPVSGAAVNENGLTALTDQEKINLGSGKKVLQADTLYKMKGKTRTTRDTMLGTNGAAPVINAQGEPSQSLSNSDFTIPQSADPVNEGQAPRRGTGAMDALGVRIAGDQGDYDASAWIRGREEAKKKTERARRQAEKRLNPTKGEKQFARGIAQGDYTAEDIPASMDRAAVEELADYYAAEESFKSADSVQRRGQEIRQENEELARTLLGDAEDYRPMPMLVMNERTPERVMRGLFGQERGEAMNRNYIYPVQQNEAEKIRFVGRMLDAVRTFQDSTGRESPLTKAERAIVQQMLEDRFVGETVASMETAQGIRNAAENIRMGKDAGDAAREFSLGAQEKELAQRLARWQDNQERLTSGEVDGVKVNHAVETYARQYDRFYDAINDFLTAHGYSTIGFIKGYAPHMQGTDTQNRLSAALSALGVNPDAMQLPTSISGLTADYKPGKRWNPFFQTRRGSSTDYDAAAGYESYVSHLADVLYHTDDIARLRGLSRYLRKTYGGEEIANAIDHAEGLRTLDSAAQLEALRDAGLIEKGSVLTPQDTRAKLEEHIDKLYKEIGHMTRYGEFVKYIDNYANILAGKQSMADRGMEYTAGRTSLNVGNRLVSAFARAQVAGNVSSALNQSAQLAQLLAEVDGRSVAKAASELARSTGGRLWNIKATELFDQSDLLTTKKGIDYLTAEDSALDRYVTALFKPTDVMDSLLSALTVQSKYEQLRGQGMEHAAAMEQADRFAQSIMASRAKGSRPLAYESKKPFSQMLHMFQVEAVNSWDHIAQDLPEQYRQVAAEHGKKAAGRAVATVAVKGLLSAFLLNRVAEAAYGGTPAPFDLLGYLTNFVASGKGMSTNAWLAGLVDAGWEKLFGEPLFGGDDDDREEETFSWGQASDDLVYNLMNDVPFLRNAAGLLGLGDQTMPLTNIAEAVKGVGQAAKNSGVISGEMGGALLTLGGSMLPGGRQMQKTVQGTQTILDGGRMYGYGDDQRLQYPVDRDPLNIVQAVLFGNSGLSESRDFYASGDTGLSSRQTQLVKDMAAEGADRIGVYDAIQDIRKGADEQEKVQALAGAPLSDQEKLQLYTEIIAGGGKRADTVGQLLEMGLSWDEIAQTFPFGSTAAAERYAGYVESGITPETAGGLARELDELEPEGGSQSVSNLQRYRAVVDYGLSQQEQLTVLQSMMDDSEYDKLVSACQSGVTPEQFISFREGISGLSADKDLTGKTISGSLKRKVMDYIDSMDLSNAQKTALYDAAGYARSTLDDAPWYGRPERSWDIIPRLDG